MALSQAALKSVVFFLKRITAGMAATPVPHVRYVRQQVVLETGGAGKCHPSRLLGSIQTGLPCWWLLLLLLLFVVVVVVAVVVVVIDFPTVCTITEPVYQYSEHRLSIRIVCSM